ncbi:MAG: cobalt-precorrin-5B (C(1))-methyltransferase CbiD [Spirochaetaceae bacterium]|jgi:cobalt-precorrin-5B (C1)-methyltransferase|nr:cobalt-precorrin-5B (C(1))-methyltransferase CbiD [Spirochaetaceae bacterium]
MRDDYRIVDGKKLRRGYTTGSCATAAAKGAAELLLGGGRGYAEIDTPAGKRLKLPLQDIVCEGAAASCAVLKDGGDDADVTSGCLVYARVAKRAEAGFAIEGGDGVGRVTLPGLDAPVGEAAINSVPRRMIREALGEACEQAGFTGGLLVTVSVPDGERLARRTFNGRLGIAGGLSILGTTGIVEPASEDAFLGAVKAELSVLRASGMDAVTLTPGNIGLDFLERNFPLLRPVKCANFIGESVRLAATAGFRRILVAGHIGKLVKLASGCFNTHSKHGDARLFIFAAFAGASGADGVLTEELLRCATSEAAIELLRGAGLWEPVFEKILEAVQARLDEFCLRQGYDDLRCEALFFSSKYGFLGRTAGKT